MAERNGYGSRKFLIAASSLVVVSFLAVWGVVVIGAEEGGLDLAAIIAAWGVCDAAILKLYNDANIKSNGV